MERYEKMAVALGMEITNERKTVCGVEVFEAKMETARGTLSIYCGSNGTARIDKPNGTHKWYYEKSPAQMRSALKQTIEFYR